MVSYLHCVLFLVLDRLALMHYTRFRSTIPCHGRPWVEHGVTTECSTIRVIVRALTTGRHLAINHFHKAGDKFIITVKSNVRSQIRSSTTKKLTNHLRVEQLLIQYAKLTYQCLDILRPKKMLCLWLHDPPPPPLPTLKGSVGRLFFFFSILFLMIAGYFNKKCQYIDIQLGCVVHL